MVAEGNLQLLFLWEGEVVSTYIMASLWEV